jgi:hypothetical protein
MERPPPKFRTLPFFSRMVRSGLLPVMLSASFLDWRTRVVVMMSV